MHFQCQVWWQPKRGSSLEEYEDAFCSPNADLEADVVRFAVADGATEASFSKQWAEAIVRAYCRGDLSSGRRDEAIAQLAREWLDLVGANPLPWYADEKLRMGAYTSIIGLTLHASVAGACAQWNAWAIGDSCLFQIRNEDLLLKWPLDASCKFSNRPALLSTKHDCVEMLAEMTISGECLSGDSFYLMTDAMAQWYLETMERDNAPIGAIPDFAGQPFENWIANLRETGQLRNDDVTLMRVLVV